MRIDPDEEIAELRAALESALSKINIADFNDAPEVVLRYGLESSSASCEPSRMRTGIIVQARMGSTRLPGKVLADLGGRSVLWHVLQRMQFSPIEVPVIYAIPHDSPIELVEACTRCGVSVSFGPEQDVLARYYQTAQEFKLDAIMRVTGDCPFIDPNVCRRVLGAFASGMWDWVANDYQPSYPIGLGVEMFTFAALELAYQDAKTVPQREHVSSFIVRDKRLEGRNLRCPINGLSDLRLTIDTQDDLDFARKVDAAGPKDYSLQATLEAVDRVKAQAHA